MRDIRQATDLESHIRDPFAHHINIAYTGRVWIENVTDTGTSHDWPDDQYVGIDVDFPIVSGLSWIYCAFDSEAEYGTRCYYVDCRIQVDDNGDIVPYDSETGYGCRIQYHAWSGGNDWRIAIAYILFGSGFLPSTAMMDEQTY